MFNNPALPLGTLSVNTLGYLLIGLLAGWTENRVFLFVGLLGGCTALIHIAAHLILGLGAVWAGYTLSPNA